MENVKTKICTKCKIEKDVSEFYKDRNKKDRLQSWCTSCRKQWRKNNTEKIAKRGKQYRKDNAEKIVKQGKQYRKDNAVKIAKQAKQYRKENAEKIKQYRKDNTEKRAEQGKQYRKDNAEKLAEQKKQYQKDNAEKIVKYQKQYRKDNAEKRAEQQKQYHKNNALFEVYSKQLETFEKTRPCPENNELLEVKCAYCGKWMQPTNSQARNRLQVFDGTMPGEQRFYCSENCKQSCPIYGQHKFPKGFKQATSREVVPLLRQLVLKRDNYECQKCGASTEVAQLHVHHIIPYTQNKMQANDPDSCVTLCKECHKEAHSKDGCRYVDLKCPKDKSNG